MYICIAPNSSTIMRRIVQHNIMNLKVSIFIEVHITSLRQSNCVGTNIMHRIKNPFRKTSEDIADEDFSNPHNTIFLLSKGRKVGLLVPQFEQNSHRLHSVNRFVHFTG